MPESLLSRRLKLGTFTGIPLYVHWSFSLSVIYMALSARQSGAIGMMFSVAQLLGVFFCVTLHEYGHALAARCFGIPTADITLLPIGGVARLREMPRIPWQELVVAVAGPAVNVVIAIGLAVALALTVDPAVITAIGTYARELLFGGPVTDETAMMMVELVFTPSVFGYFVLLLVINIMLVIFNMIPAFPMDGGRVFRSVLAMVMDYGRATSIASKVGLGCALLMGLLALQSSPPRLVPLFIAAFIAYAGMAEARQVSLLESVRGLTIRQVMLRETPVLAMDLPVPEVCSRWRSISLAALPVVTPQGGYVGMLTLKDLTDQLTQGVSSNTTAGQLVNHQRGTPAIDEDGMLADAIKQFRRNERVIAVISSEGLVSGVLDLETMLPRALLSDVRVSGLSPESIQEIGGDASPVHFDART